MADTFVEELVDYLVTAGVCTTKGTASGDIFYDYLPAETAATAACLRDTGGGPPRKHSPHGMVTVQCIVRGASYKTARQYAAQIYGEFHQMVNTDLEHNHVVYCLATAHPSSIGADERSRVMVSCNFIFKTYGLGGADGDGDGGAKDPNDPGIQQDPV